MVGEKKLNLLVPAKNALRLSMFVENCKIYSSQMAKKIHLIIQHCWRQPQNNFWLFCASYDSWKIY